MPTALVVDDDRASREGLAKLVEAAGFEVRAAADLEHARTAIEDRTPDLALLDLQLPDGSGLDLLEELKDEGAAYVVLVTGHASIDSAVGALRGGAMDYLRKPVDPKQLKSLLARAKEHTRLRDDVRRLRGELRRLGRFGRMVGASEPVQRVYDLVTRVAPTDATVLITGETGTGKELVAATIHDLSPRADKPFVAVNCGAIPENLIESELFGHERGAFTGAGRRHVGYFEQAHGGTLFLDEVTEMSEDLQVKLLRVLETSAVTRVGSTESIDVDVRLVGATNREPRQAVEDGHLREDLLYRLLVFPIELPPLKDRGEDIALLARHFLDEQNRDVHEPKTLTDEALEKLRMYSWPGNVRELRNVIERAFIVADDVIRAEHVPVEGLPPTGSGGDELRISIGTSIEEANRRLILATLDRLEGDKRKAAKTLGISLKTLYNRLNKYKAEV